MEEGLCPWGRTPGGEPPNQTNDGGKSRRRARWPPGKMVAPQGTTHILSPDASPQGPESGCAMAPSPLLSLLRVSPSGAFSPRPAPGKKLGPHASRQRTRSREEAGVWAWWEGCAPLPRAPPPGPLSSLSSGAQLGAATEATEAFLGDRLGHLVAQALQGCPPRPSGLPCCTPAAGTQSPSLEGTRPELPTHPCILFTPREGQGQRSLRTDRAGPAAAHCPTRARSS